MWWPLETLNWLKIHFTSPRRWDDSPKTSESWLKSNCQLLADHLLHMKFDAVLSRRELEGGLAITFFYIFYSQQEEIQHDAWKLTFAPSCCNDERLSKIQCSLVLKLNLHIIVTEECNVTIEHLSFPYIINHIIPKFLYINTCKHDLRKQTKPACSVGMESLTWLCQKPPGSWLLTISLTLQVVLFPFRSLLDVMLLLLPNESTTVCCLLFAGCIVGWQ